MPSVFNEVTKSYCEIIEVSHIADAMGYRTVSECSDLRHSVSGAHAEHCAVCNQKFCATCLSSHNNEQHPKKPAAADERQRRKSA